MTRGGEQAPSDRKRIAAEKPFRLAGSRLVGRSETSRTLESAWQTRNSASQLRGETGCQASVL